jgi:hypothetical protein
MEMKQFPVWTILYDASEDVGPLGWSVGSRQETVQREIIMREWLRQSVGGTFPPEPQQIDELKFMYRIALFSRFGL